MRGISWNTSRARSARQRKRAHAPLRPHSSESAQCLAQYVSDVPGDLQSRKLIGTSDATVYDRNWNAGSRRRSREAKAGKDHQGRAHDQQQLRLLERRHGTIDPLCRHVLAEENHVRLEYAAARGATRDLEALVVDVAEFGVAVGLDQGVRAHELWVACNELGLKRRARSEGPTTQTSNLVEPPVQIDDALIAGTLVQTIHVLRDQERKAAACLQL